MTNGLDRKALVSYARDSIAKGSKSFAAASRLFPEDMRENAWLLYAWCRKCDDLTDGQDAGHGMRNIDDATERVAYIRRLTTLALAGEATGEPAFDALALVAHSHQLPHVYIHAIIDGFALDAQEWRPHSQDDLYQYCYHVAGAVGCLMAIIMGVRPDDEETLDRACDLGLAFQLANIVRDIAEDDSVGRCYLPMEWLAQMDIPPGQHMKPPFRNSLVHLARRLADQAERYEASARIGAAKLSFRARWAVLAAAGIYGDIARTVRLRAGAAWDRRIMTSKTSKMIWIGRSFFMALKARETAGRNGLWTRPKSSE